MTETSTVIIVGSSRSTGNTAELAMAVASKLKASVIDLKQYQIAPFDYEFKNRDDDFLALMKQALSFERIIFATPMYWYAPSATMKTFMDRISDLLKIEKDLGRQLRSKKAALLGTGCDAEPAACFEQVFQLTFAYLGMAYQGMLYAHCENEFIHAQHLPAIDNFAEALHAQ
ncbi:flavodoxin family protein [Undibacterium sp. Di27W]|uniref:flavodoxin family protein n=1 Tax=Undibacterium sp. Di27W TaxID=3413036 RepID=UPI003BF3EFB1